MKKYKLVKGKPIGKTMTKQEWIEEHMDDYGLNHNEKFNDGRGLEICKANVQWMIDNKWLIEVEGKNE
ncbi:MAG: hypothetical protein BV457_05410 [Thermoplasmata archaeon M9B1D]|nr:MAG: hypothetical protein BV457_05410 [Thermoplasmata archaeon M9B1D]PNX50253.1 MAG: hypothetical protein BV456_07260 [Thermoplasmata archaeon M8B2D]